MQKTAVIAITLLLFTSGSFAQVGQKLSVPDPKKATPALLSGSAVEIANAAIDAHGGENFKQITSFVVRGTVDVTGAFSYVIPATFLMVISGERYVFELNNPFQPLKQVFDGKNMHSSGYELPPATSLGFPLLTRVGLDGYVISESGGAKKKRPGFRITTPEGFYTDFVVNEKTRQIKGYESSYDIQGRTVTTSVEIDQFETVKGVVVPKKYSQRFDLGQMTVYANFKTKEILINSPVADDVFAMPK